MYNPQKRWSITEKDALHGWICDAVLCYNWIVFVHLLDCSAAADEINGTQVNK